MSDISRTIELYETMAARFERSEFSPRQAKIYREIIEFMSDCATVDEAMAKIKDSPYYLGPSAALIQDKIASLQKAAEENCMPEVVQVYADILTEIDADITAMYDGAYEVRAGNIKKQYYSTMDAFQEVYRNYLRILCCVANDSTELSSALADMRKALGGLSHPSSDIAELAKYDMMRKLIPVNDGAYSEFINGVLFCMTKDSVGFTGEIQEIDRETEEVMSAIKSIKGEIKAAGKENKGKSRRANVTVKAPDSFDGVYTYDGEVL